MATIDTTAQRIVGLIESHRFRGASEARLQTGIAVLLGFAGIACQREPALTKADRIDFLVECEDGGLGIEVKMAGSRAALVRQLMRYAESPVINAILVVTSRVQLVHVPVELGGKRIYMAAILAGLV